MTIGELRNLAKSAVKSFRNDEDLDYTLNEIDLTFTEDNLPNTDQNVLNVTVAENNSNKKNTQ